MEQIEFNNRGTWTDFKLKMYERHVDPAEMKRNVLDLPHVQGVLDFSLGLNNEVYMHERPLAYRFGRVIPSRYQREQLRYEIMRWAYTYTDGILRDSVAPSWYYDETKVVNLYFSDVKDNHFWVQMEFMGHPLRKSNHLQGRNVWDDFNFDEDIWQQTKYRLPYMEDQLPFKELEIGQMVTLGGWTQFFLDGTDLSNYDTARKYEVLDRRDRENTDFSQFVYSGIQYQVTGGAWVRVQDIIEARNTFIKAELYNSGINPVVPEIIQKVYGRSTIGGISIELNGQIYNFHRLAAGEFEYNDRLSLPVGKSELKIYGQGMEVDFQFRKEVP